MTEPIDTNAVYAVGNGVDSTFSFPWRLFATDQIRLLVYDPVADTLTPLTLTTNYTVANHQVAGSGTVTLLGAYAPLPTNHVLTMRLYPPLTQEADIKNNDAYDRSDQEVDHDKRVQQMLRLANELARSIKLPEGEAGTAALTTLPSLTSRKGKLLRFNATTGNPEAVAAGTAPAELSWGASSSISTDDNALFLTYRARQTLTLTKFDVTFGTAGTGGATVVNFKLNGATVVTVTVADGATYGSAAGSVTLEDGDLMTVEVGSVAPTTPPINMNAMART